MMRKYLFLIFIIFSIANLKKYYAEAERRDAAVCFQLSIDEVQKSCSMWHSEGIIEGIDLNNRLIQDDVGVIMRRFPSILLHGMFSLN